VPTLLRTAPGSAAGAAAPPLSRRPTPRERKELLYLKRRLTRIMVGRSPKRLSSGDWLIVAALAAFSLALLPALGRLGNSPADPPPARFPSEAVKAPLSHDQHE
jgi:hypothetical protein